MQKGVIILRDSWLIAALNCAYALCTCLAQASLVDICLACMAGRSLNHLGNQEQIETYVWPRLHSDLFSRHPYQVNLDKVVVSASSTLDAEFNTGSFRRRLVVRCVLFFEMLVWAAPSRQSGFLFWNVRVPAANST
jgi:hypothetical protein